MRSLAEQIEQARRETLSSSFTPSWFVLFKTQTAASIAASTRIYAEDNTRFQVHPAPGPEEVNWQHLWMDYKERDCRTAFTWPLMLLVVLFPITLVTSAASRLEYVFCPDMTPGDPTVGCTSVSTTLRCMCHLRSRQEGAVALQWQLLYASGVVAGDLPQSNCPQHDPNTISSLTSNLCAVKYFIASVFMT